MKLNYLKKFLFILLLLNLNANAADVVKNLKDMHFFSDQTVDNLIYQVNHQNDAFEFEEHVLDIIAKELETDDLLKYELNVNKIITFLQELKKIISPHSEKYESVNQIIEGLHRKLKLINENYSDELTLQKQLCNSFQQLNNISNEKYYRSMLVSLHRQIKTGQYHKGKLSPYSNCVMSKYLEAIEKALKLKNK